MQKSTTRQLPTPGTWHVSPDLQSVMGPIFNQGEHGIWRRLSVSFTRRERQDAADQREKLTAELAAVRERRDVATKEGDRETAGKMVGEIERLQRLLSGTREAATMQAEVERQIDQAVKAKMDADPATLKMFRLREGRKKFVAAIADVDARLAELRAQRDAIVAAVEPDMATRLREVNKELKAAGKERAEHEADLEATDKAAAALEAGVKARVLTAAQAASSEVAAGLQQLAIDAAAQMANRLQAVLSRIEDSLAGSIIANNGAATAAARRFLAGDSVSESNHPEETKAPATAAE